MHFEIENYMFAFFTINPCTFRLMYSYKDLCYIKANATNLLSAYDKSIISCLLSIYNLKVFLVRQKTL